MVCNHEIEIPVQYVSMMFQVSSKRGRPTVSGKNTDVGDVEEDKSKKRAMNLKCHIQVDQADFASTTRAPDLPQRGSFDGAVWSGPQPWARWLSSWLFTKKVWFRPLNLALAVLLLKTLFTATDDYCPALGRTASNQWCGVVWFGVIGRG